MKIGQRQRAPVEATAPSAWSNFRFFLQMVVLWRTPNAGFGPPLQHPRRGGMSEMSGMSGMRMGMNGMPAGMSGIGMNNHMASGMQANDRATVSEQGGTSGMASTTADPFGEKKEVWSLNTDTGNEEN